MNRLIDTDMPELIFAEPINTAEITDCGRWGETLPLTKATPYIRADKAFPVPRDRSDSDSDNEKLKDGNFYWVKLDDVWTIGLAKQSRFGDFVVYVPGVEQDIDVCILQSVGSRVN